MYVIKIVLPDGRCGEFSRGKCVWVNYGTLYLHPSGAAKGLEAAKRHFPDSKIVIAKLRGSK